MFLLFRFSVSLKELNLMMPSQSIDPLLLPKHKIYCKEVEDSKGPVKVIFYMF